MEARATAAGSDRGDTVRPAGEDLRVTLAALDASRAVESRPVAPTPVRSASPPPGGRTGTRPRLIAGAGLMAALLAGLVVVLTSGSSPAPRVAVHHASVSVAHALPAHSAAPSKTAVRRHTPSHRRRRKAPVHHKLARAVVPAPPVGVPPTRTPVPTPTPQPVSPPAPKPAPRPHTGGTSCSFPPSC
jgi:hypothetical protein